MAGKGGGGKNSVYIHGLAQDFLWAVQVQGQSTRKWREKGKKHLCISTSTYCIAGVVNVKDAGLKVVVYL